MNQYEWIPENSSSAALEESSNGKALLLSGLFTAKAETKDF